MNRFYWLLALMGCCLLLNSCRWGNAASLSTLPARLTPKAGGMILPTALPAQPADPGTINDSSRAAALQVGQLVAVVSPLGLKLYSDATAASEVRGLYPPGATLTVLEPSGAYTIYPVRSDNHDWYRFQAADGLVGWAMIEAIVPTESLPTPTATPAG
jgi:hypothetical protein